MLIPPSVVYIRVRRPKGRGIALPLPVILLWPLIALVELAAIPVVAAMVPAAAAWGWAGPVVRAVPWLTELFASLRGLRVAVKSAGSEITIIAV